MDIKSKEKDTKFPLQSSLLSKYAVPISKEVHIFKEVSTT